MMLIDCTDDPCGTCRYCRFDREPVKAELPDVPVDVDLVAAIDEVTDARDWPWMRDQVEADPVLWDGDYT